MPAKSQIVSVKKGALPASRAQAALHISNKVLTGALKLAKPYLGADGALVGPKALVGRLKSYNWHETGSPHDRDKERLTALAKAYAVYLAINASPYASRYFAELRKAAGLNRSDGSPAAWVLRLTISYPQLSKHDASQRYSRLALCIEYLARIQRSPDETVRFGLQKNQSMQKWKDEQRIWIDSHDEKTASNLPGSNCASVHHETLKSLCGKKVHKAGDQVMLIAELINPSSGRFKITKSVALPSTHQKANDNRWRRAVISSHALFR